MKAEICTDCDGSGEWECDEQGNMYSRPIKCEECNGSGARVRLDDGKYQKIRFRF